MTQIHPTDDAPDFDVVVVGAGFTGLYSLFRLRELGFSVRVVERASDVGGTWFWNRYPGARCDIESIDYSFSFSDELRDEWVWTERYATQPEILSYLNHVADRFDLRRDIDFGTEVVEASFDEIHDYWTVTTADGSSLTARFCVLGVGNLSRPKIPQFDGLDSFRGDWYQTSSWPASGVDFTGKTVAIIGTGSTGIQAIPQIAAQAEQLFVLQRTPNYSVPARNRPLSAGELQAANRDYDVRRRICERSDSGVPIPPPSLSTFDVSEAERTEMYEAGWQRGGINALSYAFNDFFTSPEANELAQEFARHKIGSIVRDPAVAARLMPKTHIGTRRTCVDTGYFETYNRDNVQLVDVAADPIVSINDDGVRTKGAHISVDAIVFALGFDAMTGAIGAIHIQGAGDRILRDEWAWGPRAYLGLASHHFPNLFMVTGPGSPSVLSNMVVSIEQHVDWIAACLADLRERGATKIEATLDAQDSWVDHVNELANATLYPQATSWYLGANIPGKPRIFMPYVGGVGLYRDECAAVADSGYTGFSISHIAQTTTTTNDQGVSA